MKSLISLAAVLAAGLVLSTGVSVAQEKKQLAFVVNAASDFWKLAEAGVKKAQAELPNYELQFRYPAQGTAALQNALMDDLVAAGTDAIMISSVDPKNSIDAFNRIAAQVPLFTTDSRCAAVQPHRLSRLVQHRWPACRPARRWSRRCPTAASAWASSASSAPTTPSSASPASSRRSKAQSIELVDVRGDDVDFARARTNVDDVLVANPEINCMVGFYSYNPPKIYEALQAAGKLGQITVVAFDEDPVTLGAVKEGSFAGTVVQQPFEWGYQGMKLMAAYLEGDKSGVPADELIIVPTEVINKDNVDAFEADLKAKIGG